MCLVNRCISEGIRVRDITISCKTCAYAFACVRSRSYSPPKADRLHELNSILESCNIVPPILKLPRFIPEISLEKPIRLKWNKLDVEAIIVTFSKTEGENIEKVRKENIHKLLNFNGPILLSTIMPDKLLTEDTFNLTLDLVRRGGFDGVVGWDMPVYIDSPKMTSIFNLITTTLFTVRYLKEEIPTIPLFKGSDLKEMDLHAQWLKKLGFKQVALHATEYVLDYKDEFARELYGGALLRIIRVIKAQPLVIGAMSPKSFPLVLYREYPEASFAGMSWLLLARKGHIYRGSDVISLENCVMECDCEACFGKSANEVSRSVEDLAEHNLVQFQNFIRGKDENEIRLYDAVLGRGTMAVVGDLHIGTNQSLWQLCLKKIEEIRPSYLILLGDTFDYVHGDPSLWEVTEFMNTLRKLKVEIIPVFGCSDSDWRELFETMQRLSFKRGPLRPQLLEPNTIVSEAVRNLLMLYTISKEKVKVKLANEKMIMFSHGNELGLKKKDDPKEIAEALLYNKEPGITYVIGHYHKSFFKPEEGIVLLGAWQTQTREEEEIDFNPDIMEVLLIKEDGKIELIRGE